MAAATQSSEVDRVVNSFLNNKCSPETLDMIMEQGVDAPVETVASAKPEIEVLRRSLDSLSKMTFHYEQFRLLMPKLWRTLANVRDKRQVSRVLQLVMFLLSNGSHFVLPEVVKQRALFAKLPSFFPADHVHSDQTEERIRTRAAHLFDMCQTQSTPDVHAASSGAADDVFGSDEVVGLSAFNDSMSTPKTHLPDTLDSMSLDTPTPGKPKTSPDDDPQEALEDFLSMGSLTATAAAAAPSSGPVQDVESKVGRDPKRLFAFDKLAPVTPDNRSPVEYRSADEDEDEDEHKHDLAHASARTVRQLCRKGVIASGTAGMAAGHAQANLVILPQSWAFDFLVFCQRNPKPCPVLDVSDAGSARSVMMCPDDEDCDIRTDLPMYRVYRDGKLTELVPDISPLWKELNTQDDPLVCFLTGCSYGFEEALTRSGLTIRHQEEQKIVPMYKTNIQCVPAGRFSGPMVVSMRPFTPRDAIKAVEITSRYPGQHGTPVHMGDPSQIGIKDIGNPDFGEAVTIRPGEIPVFWACGVTPQAVAMASKPPFMITHAPGCMFVCDKLSDDL